MQLGLVSAIVGLETGWGALAGLVALAGSALFGWMRSLRHARLILDTPTARISSAAQGYAELRGRGAALAGTPLLSPLNALPVLWYRLTTQRKEHDGKWRVVSTSESDASFLLDDGSGIAAVDPEGAEMLVRRRDVFKRGDLRHTQTSLIAGDPIYVIGDFHTLGSVAADFDARTQVGDLLRTWKENRPELLARFDLDANGEIDIREWELARAQARREVRKRRDEILGAPEAHVVRKPENRLYLVSDLDPELIARGYRRWAIFHAAIFLGAAAAATWFAEIGVF